MVSVGAYPFHQDSRVTQIQISVYKEKRRREKRRREKRRREKRRREKRRRKKRRRKKQNN